MEGAVMDGRNREIKLPRYNEIPNVGLYLKQVVKLFQHFVCLRGDVK